VPTAGRLARAAIALASVGLVVVILLPMGLRGTGLVVLALLGVPLVSSAASRAGWRAAAPWAVYLGAVTVFGVGRAYADNWGPPAYAGYVIWLDRLLGLGEVPTLALQRWLYDPAAHDLLDRLIPLIYLSYFLVPMGTAWWLWRRHPAVVPTYLYATTGLLLVVLPFHVLIPTVPPWLAGQTGELPHVARVAIDVLTRDAQAVYSVGTAISANDVAAMPSVHMGASWLVALACRAGRWAMVLGYAYAAAMLFTIVYSGEHYLADALAGMLLAWAAWWFAGRLTPR